MSHHLDGHTVFVQTDFTSKALQVKQYKQFGHTHTHTHPSKLLCGVWKGRLGTTVDIGRQTVVQSTDHDTLTYSFVMW